MPQPPPELSVVVPVYRNRATLGELVRRIDAALVGERAELVAVVDGSPDDSLDVLLALARDPAATPKGLELVPVELARNFGQHAALCAGFELARGKCVLVLDADLQQLPEDLPRFVATWRAGHDFVSGWRMQRRDPFGRRLGSWFMNRLVRSLTGVQLHDWGCPLAAIDRSVVERVATSGEQRRFLKPLVAKLSRRPTELRIEGLAREGKSAYSSLALLGVSLDFAVSFSQRPFLKLVGLGALTTAVGVLVGGGYLVLRVLGLAEAETRLQAVVLLALIFGGQALLLGALGEFTHRIYRLVQGEPLYEVRTVHSAAHGSPSGSGQGASQRGAAATPS